MIIYSNRVHAAALSALVLASATATPLQRARGETGDGARSLELRITSIAVVGGSVTLEYEGEAGSVEGTDDLTGAEDSWKTVPGASIDAENKTATLTVEKRFMRLSPENGGGEAAGGVRLWEGGPFWAETNIGADTPADSGLFFWWGDTVGYRREGRAWVADDGSANNFSFGSWNTPTYNKSLDQLQSGGWLTAEGVLASEHDAAQAQWGRGWRMPTYLELRDLREKCTWLWTSTNGVNGYVVSGQGDFEGASIFLPAAGHGNGTSLSYAGEHGYFWSSVPYPDDRYYSRRLGFLSGSPSVGYSNRCYGFPVRPVREPVE